MTAHPVSVEYIGGYRLWVKFSDGEEGMLDMTLAMTRLNGRIIQWVRQPEVFKQARIDDDQVTVAWPRMDPDDPWTEYDICPDYLYERCVHGDGGPTLEDKNADILFA